MAVLFRQNTTAFDSTSTETGCTLTVDAPPSSTSYVNAAVAGSGDSQDKAVAVLSGSHCPSGSQLALRVYIKTPSSIGTLVGNLTILDVLDSGGREIVNLYLNTSKVLWCFSQATCLSTAGFNTTTGVTLADDTEYIVDIIYTQNSSCQVFVNEIRKINNTGLSGATAGRATPTAINVGIDHYDGSSGAAQGTWKYRNVTIGDAAADILNKPATRSVGSQANATGSAVVGAPGSLATGDLDVLVASTDGTGTVTISATGGGGWTALGDQQVASGERVYVWWRIFNSGTMSNPTVQASADHVNACRLGWVGGTFDAASPIEDFTTSSESTSDTSFSWTPTTTPSRDGAHIVCICTSAQDSASGQVPVMTNTALGSLTLLANYNTSSGNGGGFGITYGIGDAIALAQPFACTLANASPKAYACFVVTPARLIDTYTGATTLSGTGSSTTSGLHTCIGASALTGAGTSAAAGVRTTYAVSVLSGVSSMTSAGYRNRFAAAALSNITGSLATDGTVTRFGMASLTGTGVLHTSGVRLTYSVASLGGSGSLAAAGVRKCFGTSTLTGVGSLAADGIYFISGIAHLTGVGSLEAASGVQPAGAAALVGTGSLTVSGHAYHVFYSPRWFTAIMNPVGQGAAYRRKRKHRRPGARR